MQRIFLLSMLMTLLAAVPPAGAFAGQWSVELGFYSGSPEQMFVVDKSSQTIFLLQSKSPLKVLSSLNCTTGQVVGDKTREGDLRTPEGVYFLEEKIGRTLDDGLYGNLAYRLNYPNPVDIMQGKTGSGIWLHGRGWSITPRETRGCVALDTEDLKNLESNIRPGMTPVLVAESVTLDMENDRTHEQATALSGDVMAWAAAWQGKSDSFFSFYNATGFTRSSGNPFSHFKNRKKRLFAANDWIQVFVDDLRLIPGPGYWVASFKQYYRTPSFTSQGVKRLYWQQSESGWKIVGSEWVDAAVALEKSYLAAKDQQLRELLYAWCLAMLTNDHDRMNQLYASKASFPDGSGGGSVEHFDGVDIMSMRTSIHPQGVEIIAGLHYRKGKDIERRIHKVLIVAPFPEGWRIVGEGEMAGGK